MVTESLKSEDNLRNMEGRVAPGWMVGGSGRRYGLSQWGMTLISVFWPQECSAVMGRVECWR